MANLKILPLKVHFKEESIATIALFSNVCEIQGIKVIFDLDLGINFNVTLPTGLTYFFKYVNAKLFYFNTAVDLPFMNNDLI